jgi:putative ABC transport system substrate-binding protein
MKAFRGRLAEMGYVEGQNIVIDQRYAHENRDRVPALITECMALRARVIVVVGPYVLRIASRLGGTTPLVAIDLESDPVAERFVASLARPGGRITGTFLDQAELSGKWLELLKEINPRLSRVSVIWDSSTPQAQIDAIKAGATSMAVKLQTLTFKTSDDLKPAFDAASRGQTEAVIVLSSPIVSGSGALLAGLSASHRLPTVSMFRENVIAGCLVSYGPSLVDGWRRLGFFVGRILNGATPADLPIERPTTFELVLNLKTARALGLTIPPSLLARADQVIE